MKYHLYICVTGVIALTQQVVGSEEMVSPVSYNESMILDYQRHDKNDRKTTESLGFQFSNDREHPRRVINFTKNSKTVGVKSVLKIKDVPAGFTVIVESAEFIDRGESYQYRFGAIELDPSSWRIELQGAGGDALFNSSGRLLDEGVIMFFGPDIPPSGQEYSFLSTENSVIEITFDGHSSVDEFELQKSSSIDLYIRFLEVVPGGIALAHNLSSYEEYHDHGVFKQRRTRWDFLEKSSPDSVGWLNLGELTPVPNSRHHYKITSLINYSQVIELGLNREDYMKLLGTPAAERGDVLSGMWGIKKFHIFFKNGKGVVIINRFFTTQDCTEMGRYRYGQKEIYGYIRPPRKGSWLARYNSASSTAFVTENVGDYELDFTTVELFSAESDSPQKYDSRVHVILRTW